MRNEAFTLWTTHIYVTGTGYLPHICNALLADGLQCSQQPNCARCQYHKTGTQLFQRASRGGMAFICEHTDNTTLGTPCGTSQPPLGLNGHND